MTGCRGQSTSSINPKRSPGSHRERGVQSSPPERLSSMNDTPPVDPSCTAPRRAAQSSAESSSLHLSRRRLRRRQDPRRRFVALAASFDAGAVSAEIKLNFAAGAIVNRVDFVDCLDASCWTSHRQNPFEDPGANSKLDSFCSIEIGGGVGSRDTEKTLTLENASNGFESALKDILCKHLQTTTVTIKSHD